MKSNSKFRHNPLPPWALALWFVFSIIWLVFFNLLFIEGNAANEWLGIISNIPVWGFAMYMYLQALRRRDRRKLSKDDMRP